MHRGRYDTHRTQVGHSRDSLGRITMSHVFQGCPIIFELQPH
jgi:hypothetical protein